MQANIWSPEDVELFYRVKPATTRLWCRKGCFKAWKIGALWRFYQADFEAFMRSNQKEDLHENRLAILVNS